jgi:hypothetical protein
MQHTRGARLVLAFHLVAGCSSGTSVPGHGDASVALSPDAEPPRDASLADGPIADQPGSADGATAVDAPSRDTAVVAACASLPPAPLRRLTNVQYQRTVRDLVMVTPTTVLPFEESAGGFEDRAEVQAVDPARVAAWNQAATEIVAALAPRLTELLACPTNVIDEACARTFITRFGLRAYRRPLTAAERDEHLALFTLARDLGDGTHGINAVLRAMLQSPLFLYRPETMGTAAGGRVTLSSWELASRLSYFLWGTMPDAELFGAASTGTLTGDVLSAQVRRMLLDSRARQGTNDFARQWLSLDHVLERVKDPVSFPQWTPALAAAMREEGYRFIQRVIFDGDGRLTTLFTSTESVLNAPLGQLYGVPLTGTMDWQPASLAGTRRNGLLTQGWFLADHAGAVDPNPSTRGAFIRARFFCQEVPPPPANIPPPPPSGPPEGTNRDRANQYLASPACAACHALMNPLGFPFESYDAIGAFRITDNGKPIETSGIITGTDVDGPVADVPALLERLVSSQMVRDCVATRFYEQAIGRTRGELDACQLEGVQKALTASGGNLRELLATVAQSPFFRVRPAAEISAPGLAQPLVTTPQVQPTVTKATLDLLAAQLTRLRQQHLDPRDRERLDQHLTGLRELEQRLGP